MKARTFAFIALLIGGCGSDSGTGAAPIDVAGVYSGPVTNGPNTCPGLWNTGVTNQSMVTLAQTGAKVSVQVQGAARALLLFFFGSNSFDGTVSGGHIDASIIGSPETTRGGCVYKTNGTLTADLVANTLTGSITYTPQPNGHADCTTMMVTGCSSRQDFALNRPPKTP